MRGVLRTLKDERGFTFIDALLIMIVVLILALILTPKITDALARVRVNAAAQKLVADIRYVRELALSHHAVYGIEFRVDQNSYELFSLSGNTKTLITDPYRSGSMVVDFDNLPEFGGVTLGSITNICTDANQCTTSEIRVDAFGNPKDRLNAAFTNNVTVTLQKGSFSRTVRVTPQTAFTELV
jgi:Tfp pilus assembly protein FimT